MFNLLKKTSLYLSLSLGLVACGGDSDKPLETYRVTAVAADGGHVEISNPAVFKADSTVARVIPDPHYKIVSVKGCGGKLFEDGWYGTGSILANCEITPVFALETFTVSVAVVPGGTVTPSTQEISYGGFAKVTVEAEEGYSLKSISGCNGVFTAKSYTTGPITSACKIVPVFEVAPVVAVAPIISGLAAEGAALGNTEITAKCSDGSGFLSTVTTDAQGYFSGSVGASALPCALGAVDVHTGAQYFSLATQAGRTNITPLTSLVIALASGQTGNDWLAQNNWQSTVSQLPDAQVLLRFALTDTGYLLPNDAFLPFSAEFKVGDEWDEVLDNLQLAVKSNQNIGSFNALVNLVKDGNLSSLPSPQ